MKANKARQLAIDVSDAIIDTEYNKVIKEIETVAPKGEFYIIVDWSDLNEYTRTELSKRLRADGYDVYSSGAYIGKTDVINWSPR